MVLGVLLTFLVEVILLLQQALSGLISSLFAAQDSLFVSSVNPHWEAALGLSLVVNSRKGTDT